MKRTWKNFRVDKNKVYAFIGKVVVLVTVYGMAELFILWSLTRITVYR